MANEAQPSPHYSRMPGIQASVRPTAASTPTQRLAERGLFALFGGMLALGAIALYATTTEAHKHVPRRVEAGLAADRLNLLVIATEPATRFGRTAEATAAMTLVSIRPSAREAALVGLPLHLWADLGKHGQRPLGAALEVGNAAGTPGGGDGLTIHSAERTVGLPIHGYLRLSLDQLARSIDGAGGVEVSVARGIYDASRRERFPRGRRLLDARQAVVYGFSSDMVGFAADAALREDRAQAVIRAALPAILESGTREQAFVTNLTQADRRLLRQLVGTSSLVPVDLTPHLLRTVKSTAVHDGEAWVPLHGSGAFRKAAAAAVMTRSGRN